MILFVITYQAIHAVVSEKLYKDTISSWKEPVRKDQQMVVT